ncbi:DUF1731 domain-containing protein [Nocardioides lentus]
MRDLRHAWGTRLGPPATRAVAGVGARVLGSDPELLLTSRRVLPTRLVLSGFRFSHPTWPDAARDLVARARGRDEGTGVVATLRATSAGTAG